MGRASLKIGQKIIKETIDFDTGEVMDREIIQHKYLVKDKEQFYLLYTSILGVFQELSHPSIKVYAYLIEHHSVNTIIGIGEPVISRIKEVSGLGVSTIRKALNELSEKCLLIKYKDGRGYYEINPKYAWKGSVNDRSKRLKYLLELGFDLGI